MLLTEKYSPEKIDEFIGNEESRMKIKQWILNWMRKEKQRPILVHGPTGVGKTSLAYAMGKEFDIDIIEMNSSDIRNKKRIERVMSSTLLAGTLTGKGKMLLIDDVDVLNRNDRGAASAISSLFKEANAPIILTAEDPWNKKLSQLRQQCMMVELKKVTSVSIFKLLKKIAEKENILLHDDFLREIAENSNGDVRSALNDLQARMPGHRDRKKDIFQRMKIIFKSKTYKDAREATLGDIDYDLIKLWVDENIPNEYEYTEDLAAGYDVLSRADIFDGRIKHSRWSLMRYSIILATVGVGLAKKDMYRKFTRYSFPNYLKKMSRTIETRSLRKSIGSKIGEKTHSSRRIALGFLPVIADISKKHPEATMDFYKFSDSELGFILEKPVRKIRR